MANLSTKIFGLAGAAVVFAGMAFGQQATCGSNSATPLLVRAESTNDLAGDFFFKCTLNTGFAAVPVGTINVQVFAPTGVTFTSKVLDTTNGYTEAVAWTPVTKNTPATPGVGGAGSYTAATASLGTISPSGNSITFIGIPTPALAVGGDYFQIEISNVRVNPSGLAVTTGTPPGISLTPVVSGGAVFQGSISSSQVAIVEYALGGASIAKGYPAAAPGAGANNFVVCKTLNPTAAAGADVSALAFVLKISENFTTAFRNAANEASPIQFPARGVPTNGVPPPAIGASTNAASTDTRFKAVFTNIPANVSLYTTFAPIVSANGGGVGMAQYTNSETGASTAAAVTVNTQAGFVSVPVSSGTATAVFDIVAQDPNALDVYYIPFYVTAASGTVAPSATQLGITVSMAPTGAPTNTPNFNASAGSTVTLKGSAFNACSTSLLFPFVTNQLGFDTGLAIANTSSDPFGANGATAQAGTCNMSFYGAGAPSPNFVSTPNIPTGTVFTQVLSGVAAGFQGYIIAQCTFQYAHGFAFITDGVGVNGGLSQGYLAGVIPDTNQVNRGANPIGFAGGGSGESLGN